MFHGLMNKLKGALRRMGLISNIKEISEIQDLPVNDEFYQQIEVWKALYQGYYSEWHEMKYTTLNGEKTRRMSSLNMPKVMAQEMATLIFNERCEFSFDDTGLEEFVTGVFDENKFNRKFQHYLEYAYAISGSVIKPYFADGKIKLSYVTADNFIPISWDNKGVREAIFPYQLQRGKKTYTHLEWHVWEGETYVVKNELYVSEREGELGKNIPLDTLYEDLDERVPMKDITRPLFVYFSANTANNLDMSSPLGVPLYNHAMDTVYSLDVAFDSFEREFRLGKRRIIVPATAVRAVPDENGILRRYFDANDEVYEAINLGGMDSDKITDNTVEIRVEEHISAINALLNVLAMQCGFSAGTFTFDGQGMKTATEVVSENSKTFRTKQAHETIIEEGLRDLVEVIVQMAELYEIYSGPDEWEFTVAFDDSIAEDKAMEVERQITLVGASLQSKKRALMRIHGITEEEAEDLLEEINEENAVATAESVDFFGGGDDPVGGAPTPPGDNASGADQTATPPDPTE